LNQSAPLLQPTVAAREKRFYVLKWIGIIAAIGVIGMQVYQLYVYYTVRLPQNQYSSLRIVAHHVRFITDMALSLMAVVIFFKSRVSVAFYLALAIVSYEINGYLPYSRSMPIYLLIVLSSIVTGILFIFSLQHFPRRIMPDNIDHVIRYKWLRGYFKALLKPKVLWITFFAILACFAVVEYVWPSLVEAFSNLLILLTAFGYLYVNYRFTNGIENARILWLFWGLFMYILLQLAFVALFMYRAGTHDTATILLAIAAYIVLLLSFSMSLFFANTFDTGKFVTRTAVNGVIFVIVLIVYNTVEHYVSIGWRILSISVMWCCLPSCLVLLCFV